MNDRDQNFIARCRASLEQRAEQLEPHQASRLRAARNRALQAGLSSRSHYGWASGVAAALALVMAVGIWVGDGGGRQQTAVPELTFWERPADLQMLTVADSQELFENLDFYLWLEQQEQRPG